MIHGFRQIASLTLASRILGMVRDMAYSYFLGAGGLMDAWTIAFRIPNLARRMFGEGAASASFIPVYSEQLERDPDTAGDLASTVVSVVVAITTAVVLLGWLGMGLYGAGRTLPPDTNRVLTLSSIMLPYMVMVCAAAILAGILNVHKHFAAPAAAPVLLNVCIIATLGVTGWALHLEPELQVFYVAIGVLAAGVAQLILQWVPLRGAGVNLRPAWAVRTAPFRRIMWLMGPMMVGLTATQLNTLADDMIAWWFSASPQKGPTFEIMGHTVAYPLVRGSVSHLYYAQRLYQFPLGVLGISLATAVFPVMSTAAARKDYAGLLTTCARGLGGAIFVALPAAVGLILVAEPLIAVVFQHGQFTAQDTRRTAWTLSFYALGLCGYFGQQIVTRAFYSVQDSKMPAMTALLAVGVNLVLNLTLIWPLGTAGLAASTALCSYLQVIVLVGALRRRYGPQATGGLIVTGSKTALGTLIMAAVGGAGLVLMRPLGASFSADLVRLMVLVLGGAGVYILVARLLGNEMLAMLLGRRRADAVGRVR